MREEFFKKLDKLLAENKIIVERRAGSAHPQFKDYIYPYDYGYFEDTTSSDGHEIDVWRGDLETAEINAVIVTFDGTKNDSEIKVLVGCSEEAQKEILTCHNRGEMSAILIERSSDKGPREEK